MLITEKQCNKCKKDFTPTKGSKGKFCSYDCYWSSMRKERPACLDCGKITTSITCKRCKTCEVKRRTGRRHPGWKGALVGYRALHNWVARELGQPTVCESCNCEGVGHSMHWANISGEYKRELSDWMRLCAYCHKQYDLEKLSM